MGCNIPNTTTKITREWCDNQTDAKWINQKVNFDNVAIGYLALFQVVSDFNNFNFVSFIRFDLEPKQLF